MIDDHQLKKWFVLTTRPRAEKQVGVRLTENNFENFVPLHRQLKQWHDRKKWVESPLFNSYIFVRTTDQQRNQVFNIKGTIKYISFGGQVCTITTTEI